MSRDLHSKPATTSMLLHLARSLHERLDAGPCERAPKRCFDPEQRGNIIFADWDHKAMCDSCAAAWHLAQAENILRARHEVEREVEAEKERAK